MKDSNPTTASISIPPTSSSYSNSRIITRKRNGNDLLLLLRGPLLVAVVVVSILVYVVQTLSWTALAQIGLLGLGCLLTCYDSVRIGHDRFREYVNEQLEGLVWDDVLYKFFHPNVIWWRYFTDTFLGHAAWAYWLPSTPEQRRRLLQATLHLDNESDAQHILFSPGGYKHVVLPNFVLKWLDGAGKNDVNVAATNEATTTNQNSVETISIDEDHVVIGGKPTVEGDTDSSASSVSGLVNEAEFPEEVFSRSKGRNLATSQRTENKSKEKKTLTAPADPSLAETFQAVLFDTVTESVKNLLSYTPNQKQTAAVGLAAALSLGVQLRYSKRSRAIALGFLEASSVAGLSAVAVGSGSLLLTKMLFSNQLHEGNIVSYMSILLKWRKNVRKLLSSADSSVSGGQGDRYKKWACILTALLIIGVKQLRGAQRQRSINT